MQADAAELGGIAEHDDLLGPRHHLLVQAGLRFVIRGQAKLQIQTIDAEEQFVEAVIVQARLGLHALYRQRLLAQPPAGQHQLDALGVRQFPGDVQAIGHHRHPLQAAQMAGHVQRGGAAVDDDVVANLDQPRRRCAYALLERGIDRILLVNMLFRRHIALQRGAAVAAVYQSLLFQHPQVGADSHCRHPEPAHQSADLDIALLRQQLQDFFAAFFCVSHEASLIPFERKAKAYTV